MRVRLIFYCPHCGSLLFRPSAPRSFRDSFVGSLGFHAQRCYMCRTRFYLYKPNCMKNVLEMLDRPLPSLRPIQPKPVEADLEPLENKSRPVATPISYAPRFRRQPPDSHTGTGG
jgi:hypothetical protein